MQRRERRRQHVEDDLRILGESRGQPDRRPGRRQDLHHSGHLDQDGAGRHERRGLRGSFIARMGSRRTRTDGAGHHGRQEQLDRSPRAGQSGPQTGRKRQDARNHGQPVRILQFDVARSRLFDRPLQGAPDRTGDHGLRPESGLRMDGERPRRRGGRRSRNRQDAVVHPTGNGRLHDFADRHRRQRHHRDQERHRHRNDRGHGLFALYLGGIRIPPGPPQRQRAAVRSQRHLHLRSSKRQPGTQRQRVFRIESGSQSGLVRRIHRIRIRPYGDERERAARLPHRLSAEQDGLPRPGRRLCFVRCKQQRQSRRRVVRNRRQRIRQDRRTARSENSVYPSCRSCPDRGNGRLGRLCDQRIGNRSLLLCQGHVGNSRFILARMVEGVGRRCRADLYRLYDAAPSGQGSRRSERLADCNHPLVRLRICLQQRSQGRNRLVVRHRLGPR